MTWLRRLVLGVSFLVVLLLGALVFIDNSSAVALRFLDWQTPALSLYWWLLGTFVVGVAVGWLVSMVTVVRAKSSERKVRRELTRTQQQAGAPQG